MADASQLAALLAKKELTWLRDRVQRRLSRQQGLDGTVTLRDPTRRQVAAAGQLLGRTLAARKRLEVSLPELSAIVSEAGLGTDIADALDGAGGTPSRAPSDPGRGPPVDEDRWAAALSPLEATAAGRPALQRWVRDLRARDALRELADDPESAAQLAARAGRVLAALPADGVRIATLAGARAGDIHALDAGTALDTLVVGALRALAGEPLLRGEEARRESYADFGVLVDDLTNGVLVLNLRARGPGLCDQLLHAAAAAGEPVTLTLGQLMRHPPDLHHVEGRAVSVCENVIVLAEAASRLGPGSGPIVCTQGQPTVAGMRLLALLSRAGAVLRYHGDFDWPGIAMANNLRHTIGIEPWRYCAADYRRADGSHAVPLTGEPVEADWDPELRTVMEETGTAIDEAAMVELLLPDLAPRR